MPKIALPARLEPELIARLNRISKANNVSVNDTVSIALNALEREQKEGNSVAQRVLLLEQNLSALLELLTGFNSKLDDKFNEASFNEKERLKSLLKLLDTKMSEHDSAEQARFDGLTRGVF